MLRRSAVVLTVAGFCLSSQYLAGSEELNQRLHRLFATNDLKEKSFGPARWTKRGSAYTTVEPSKAVPGAKDIIEYETESGKRSVLISAAQLKPPKGENALAIEDYQWDKDAKRLLIFTESKKVWRTNTRGDYWVLDREKNSLKKIGGDAPASSLMFAKFSPDGTQVAYVRANNLYVQDLNTDAIRELTPDGSETVVNGASDWVYEEELSVRDGFRWSPDSRSIAFWQFDQSGVQMFTLMNNTDDLYPKLTKFPYPKAGTKNSAVRVGVVDAAGGAPRWMQVPGDAREHYIFRIDWVENELAIGQLNRKQNTATVFLANPQTGSTKPIFEDHDEAWVDVRENGISGYDDRHSRWLNDHKGFVWMSERDGWDRAYLVPRSGGQKEPITTAAADVIAMEALDPDGKWIYFIASPENATQRYLFRSSIDRPGPAVQLSPANMPGTHSYDISPDCRWAFHRYSRFDRPVSIDLISLPDHKTVRMLEGNDLLRANTASLVEPPVEFLQLALADGFTVDGLLLKPRNFDASKKYPLVIYVYGEPASTTVRDAWSGTNSLFLRALANDGYLVASFDNRGTPAPKGRAWRKAVYGSVGVISSMEQTQAVYALAKQRDYVDLNRVGVWGWSGGGANTLNQMFRSPDLYRVGVAVAPVPDQKLYDTIYQERYMGLPAENADGYRAGSPINFVDGLRGKLLVVHGSGDDNVHFQGTQRLINRLVELGKPFDFMEYPNRTHSISEGSGTSLHVYSLIARYFEEHLPAGPR